MLIYFLLLILRWYTSLYTSDLYYQYVFNYIPWTGKFSKSSCFTFYNLPENLLRRYFWEILVALKDTKKWTIPVLEGLLVAYIFIAHDAWEMKVLERAKSSRGYEEINVPNVLLNLNTIFNWKEFLKCTCITNAVVWNYK